MKSIQSAGGAAPTADVGMEIEALLLAVEQSRDSLMEELRAAAVLLAEVEATAEQLSQFGYQIPQLASQFSASVVQNAAAGWFTGDLSGRDFRKLAGGAIAVGVAAVAVGVVVEGVANLFKGFRRSRVEQLARESIDLFYQRVAQRMQAAYAMYEAIPPYERVLELTEMAMILPHFPDLKNEQTVIRLVGSLRAMKTTESQLCFFDDLFGVYEEHGTGNLQVFLAHFYSRTPDSYLSSFEVQFRQDVNGIAGKLRPVSLGTPPPAGEIAFFQLAGAEPELASLPKIRRRRAELRRKTAGALLRSVPFGERWRDVRGYMHRHYGLIPWANPMKSYHSLWWGVALLAIAGIAVGFISTIGH